MPIEAALEMAEEYLARDLKSAYRDQLRNWFSSLGYYSQGGEPPAAPEAPSELYED